MGILLEISIGSRKGNVLTKRVVDFLWSLRQVRYDVV